MFSVNNGNYDHEGAQYIKTIQREVMWDHYDRNVVFPSDESFYRSLLKSKFSLDDNVILNLPATSFILAMPRGFKFNDVSIPSPLVTYFKAKEREDYYATLSSLMGFDDGQRVYEDKNGQIADSI
ncbi:MAG: hypothetical protein ACJAS1_000533 [Oleiphilaceae bacterium]